MTPLELLQAYRTRVGDALFGADYVDAPDMLDEKPTPTSRNKSKQSFQKMIKTTPDGIRLRANSNARWAPKGNAQFRMPEFGNPTPRIDAGVQPLVNTNPIGLKPRPVYPGPAGRNIGGSGTGIKGGVVQTAAGLIGDKLIEMGSPEVIRGLMVVTGQDTNGYDRMLAGLPRVKNFGGVSYNIDTPEGLAAARKARESGEKISVPTRPGTPPKITDNPPKITEDPPKITDNPPKITEDPPKITDNPPIITENPPVTLTTGLDTGSGSREARLDPNATERYASNFKAGQANMSDIQEMYADRKDLQEWAKANPALAQKEYSKVMGKEKAADMAAYAEDYGSPMNQQSEMIFEQGKPTVTTTSQFDVLNNPSELSVPGKSAYDLAMANTNFIGQQDIPETDNTQEFLTAQMKKYGLVK